MTQGAFDWQPLQPELAFLMQSNSGLLVSRNSGGALRVHSVMMYGVQDDLLGRPTIPVPVNDRPFLREEGYELEVAASQWEERDGVPTGHIRYWDGAQDFELVFGNLACVKRRLNAPSEDIQLGAQVPLDRLYVTYDQSGTPTVRLKSHLAPEASFHYAHVSGNDEVLLVAPGPNGIKEPTIHFVKIPGASMYHAARVSDHMPNPTGPLERLAVETYVLPDGCYSTTGGRWHYSWNYRERLYRLQNVGDVLATFTRGSGRNVRLMARSNPLWYILQQTNTGLMVGLMPHPT